MILFFDTETTGKWIKGLPNGSVEQPKTVQLAAILTYEDGTEAMSMNAVVYQEHVPDEAAAIHGLTTGLVGEIGMNEGVALAFFEEMLAVCERVVGHNVEYDINVITNAVRLLDKKPNADPFAGKDVFCTMRSTTAICRIPNNGRGGFKWPKLSEAYAHFNDGQEFDGAHDALADVRACKDVYFKVLELAERKLAERQAAA